MGYFGRHRTVGWIVTAFVLLLMSAGGTIGKGQKRDVLLTSGWQYNSPPQQQQHPEPPIITEGHPNHQYFFPRTENYYHRMKPDAVVEIVMDPVEEIGNTMVEHSSMTTSVQSQSEYRTSCIREPGCRWECEPRADDLPPDCDCVCFYTDAKWDTIP